GRVETVRELTGSWDSRRATEGAYAALLALENGAFASLTYSGYGHFDSYEFQGWIGEMGESKTPYAKCRRRFETAGDEIAFKNARNYGGGNFKYSSGPAVVHQNFLKFVVGCGRAGALRVRHGVMVFYERSPRC